MLWTVFAFVALNEQAHATLETPGMAFAACGVAIAMGLQSASTGYLRLGTFRTSFMTGALADIGMILALIVQEGWRMHRWRLFQVAVVVMFWFGATLGAVGYSALGQYAGIVPACMFTVIAIVALCATWNLPSDSRKSLLDTDAF